MSVFARATSGTAAIFNGAVRFDTPETSFPAVALLSKGAYVAMIRGTRGRPRVSRDRQGTGLKSSATVALRVMARPTNGSAPHESQSRTKAGVGAQTQRRFIRLWRP